MTPELKYRVDNSRFHLGVAPDMYDGAGDETFAESSWNRRDLRSALSFDDFARPKSVL